MLVVDCGLTPDYVLDMAEEWEIESLLDRISQQNIPLQQLLRLNLWATLQVNSKEKINPSDILKFDWENTDTEENTTTQQDITDLQNKAKEFERLWQNNQN